MKPLAFIDHVLGEFIIWFCRCLGAGFGLWMALKTTGLLP